MGTTRYSVLAAKTTAFLFDGHLITMPKTSEGSPGAAIVAHIAAETAPLDTLAVATERSIALLKERRAALIAAAVTGWINVPESDL